MKIYDWNKISKKEKSKILNRIQIDFKDYYPVVEEIIYNVKKNKDKALIEYALKFDKAKLTKKTIKVTQKEFNKAYKRCDKKLLKSIEYAAENIFAFHNKQKGKDFWIEQVRPGIFAGEREIPIDNAALYVPRGKGSFPSVMLMLGIPAKVAKVERIVVLTPPNEKSEVDDATLAAAELLGIKQIYKAGGAQAIAAAAYGTDTIPKMLKILGPGNIYVTVAKRLLSSLIDVGLPAGPSESIIFADEYADPENTALDLLIEAEHGPDSAALLVTHSRKLVKKLDSLIGKFIKKIPKWRRDFINTVLNEYGGAIITGSKAESIDFINEYAPEHLEILTKDFWDDMYKIKNSGEIMLGEYTPITLSNYAVGVNAILPTGQWAKSYSGVGVNDFVKKVGIGYVDKDSFKEIAQHCVKIADFEGFYSHKLALTQRLKKIKKGD